MRPNKFTCSIVVLVLASVVAAAQSAAPTAQPAGSNANMPVFHVESKLVLVDVVVTDKSGNVIEGLKPADFQLNEGGKPQRIRFFEEHTAPRAKAPMQLPKLPAGQYTNFPTDPPKSTINILLFDLLNTAPNDLVYAKKQMLKALQNLPPGKQMSLFILSGGLTMVQGPSGDTATLVRVAQAMSNDVGTGRLVKSQAQAAGESTAAAVMESQAGPSQVVPGAGGGSTGSVGTPDPIAERIRTSLMKETKFNTDDRVGATLIALEALARMVSGYPGRKNLIWITGGVPFEIGADTKADKYHRFSEKREYLPMMVKAGSMLADAQIAIYPVDVSGLSVQGVNMMTSGNAIGGSGAQYRTTLDDQHTEAFNNRVTMEDLADKTGGQAFVGSNDLAKSITNAVQFGERYYTLAYVPTNQNWDGNFRPIEVRTERGGIKLTYRKGYLAVADRPPSKDDAVKTLAAAMQLGMPTSTALLMRVAVQPPDAQSPKVRIDYAVAADEVQFTVETDHSRRAMVDFMAAAWDEKGKVVDHTFYPMAATIKPGADDSQLRGGLPAHQELDLKPGKYNVCLGVMDRTTQKIGTVWVELVVPPEKK